jgi:hypothetical protein
MTKREEQQQERAEDRKQQLARRQNDVAAPVETQPSYEVPDSEIALRDAQTASWSTHEEIRILRYCLQKESAGKCNPNTITALTRAIDAMIARQQSTALRCGEYLSRQAASDFVKALISVATETVQAHAPELYDVIIDDMRERMAPYFDPNLATTIVATNERYEK